MGRFKPLRVQTTKFKPISQVGCSWCINRVRPASGETICEKCVEGFKRLLQSHDWRVLRLAVLNRQPFCICGCEQPADQVDHEEPWRTHPDLFWHIPNLRSMYHTCHQLKTNKETRERK